MTGVDAIKGKEPPYSTDTDYLDSLEFTRTTGQFKVGAIVSHSYKYCGLCATAATEGGHGGCAGQGGNSGNSLILGFNDKEHIFVNKQKGIFRCVFKT